MWTIRITYENKKTLARHDLTFKYALDEKHALKIAKKLRPKFHRIVAVNLFQITTPPSNEDALPDEWPSDLT